jgi:hypothetical protein
MTLIRPVVRLIAFLTASILLFSAGISGSESASGRSTGGAPARTSHVQSAPDEPGAAPVSWQTILSEGFEGSWPGSGWTVTDLSGDGYDRKWGKEDFKPRTGSYSAWPASAGTHRVDASVGFYPENMNTRMVYGPFDLSDATAAELHFWLWTEIDADYDWLYLGSSANGSSYSEEGTWEGTLDWSEIVIDLSSYAGDSSVWVRWDFASDDSVALAGPFVDDVTISKDVLDPPAVSISRSGSNVTLQWPAVAGATSYEVWWGTNTPYFGVGANCATTPASCTVINAPTNPPSFTQAGGSGNTTNNHTYLVRAVSGISKSAPSNRTGEFDYALTR